MIVRRFVAATLAALSFAQPAFAVQMTPFADKPFTDVPESYRSYTPIEYLRTNNIVKGYLDGSFKPNQEMTRAEFVQLVTNPFFLNADLTNDCLETNTQTDKSAKVKVFFPDVKADDWFATAVCIAKLRNIIRGYPDGTFKPNEKVSFVEAAKMVASVFAVQMDKQSVGDEKWYTIYIQQLDAHKAIPSTIKRLTQNVTRAEMAEMVYRLKADDETRATTDWSALTQ